MNHMPPIWIVAIAPEAWARGLIVLILWLWAETVGLPWGMSGVSVAVAADFGLVMAMNLTDPDLPAHLSGLGRAGQRLFRRIPVIVGACAVAAIFHSAQMGLALWLAWRAGMALACAALALGHRPVNSLPRQALWLVRYGHTPRRALWTEAGIMIAMVLCAGALWNGFGAFGFVLYIAFGAMLTHSALRWFAVACHPGSAERL